MTREERTARSELETLAARDAGRKLLQLALRGIHESGRGLTVGCWVKPNGGVSGCVFQHAYWQGVAEGTFAPADTAKPGIREFVPAEDFRLVMDAIRALDALGKRRFLRRRGVVRVLDEVAWRNAVERLLVDALAAATTERQSALVTA
ncbi:MAG: hypothetical protein ACR2L0_00250 [Gaiellaceae bacterium]